MSKTKAHRDRLSIDISPEEHRKIKLFATFHGETIKDYVLESVRERLKQEKEDTELLQMTSSINPVLQEIWDNEKDTAYDSL